MASFPSRNLNQKAVYWGSPTKDGFGGLTWADPIEISCRWIDSNEQILVSNGDQIISRAKVTVNQDLDEQGMLHLGEIADLTAAQKANPKTLSSAFPIKKFDKVPTINKPIRFFRKAFL